MKTKELKARSKISHRHTKTHADREKSSKVKGVTALKVRGLKVKAKDE